MRVEGWLQLKVGSTPYSRKYVVIDGYVLRAFPEEPMLTDTPAALLLDLRMVQELRPEDVLIPSGPCQIEMKSKGKPKIYILASEAAFVADTGSWFLPTISAAVADRACAASIRARYRKVDMVLGLMRDHAQQPSAHDITDAKWRRQRRQDSLKRAQNGDSGPRGGTPRGTPRRTPRGTLWGTPRGTLWGTPRGTPRGGHTASSGETGAMTPRSVDIAHALERAQQNRHLGQVATSADDGSIEASCPPDSNGLRPSDEHEHGAYAPASSGLDPRAHATGHVVSEPPIVPALRIPPPSPTVPETLPLHDCTVDRAQDAEAEEAGGWWWVKVVSSVEGPLRPAEMRRQYHMGKISHATLVRFVPFDEEPAKDEHVGQPFCPLQELCSASGPPFMQRIPSPRH